MSVPTLFDMPTYFIYRDAQPGQSVDPMAQLIFCPARDSDELFDALRMKYPQFRTHSERMREAVIEFLREEQLAELATSQLPTPTTAPSTMTSPWQASMQSMSSGSSVWSSPELLDLATPSFANSPQPQTQPLSRQQSVATTATVPSNPTPPAIEHMTGVFSLSDAAQPKQRVRRKMTEAEKVEYRKRRIVKACEKCSKRKRKCNHNHLDMESVAASKAQKVTKPVPPATSKKAAPLPAPQVHQENQVFGASALDFSDSFTSDTSMPALGDYSTIFEDPLPDMSLDDLLMPHAQQWPWSDTPDFTLMDSSLDSLYSPQPSPQHYPCVSRNIGYSSGGQDIGNGSPMLDLDLTQITRGGSSSNMLWEHLRTGQHEVPTEKQQPTHTPHVHEMDEKELFEYDADYAAPSHDWNDAGRQSNQTWPQHSIQFQDRTDTPQYSLPDMTLRLTGTAKAVRAFANVKSTTSPRLRRLQSVSLKDVALLALGSLAMAQNVQSRSSGAPRRAICQNASCTTGKHFVGLRDLHRHLSRHFTQDDPRGGLDQDCTRDQWQHLLDTTSDGMTIEDFLRSHTNATPIQEDGRETISRTPHGRRKTGYPSASSIASVGATAPADVERSAKSKIQSSNPDSEFSRDKMLKHHTSAARQGRHTSSLGEGLTARSSPSTELYLLKRRTPKSLHSIVASDSPAAALGPLLMTIPDVDTYKKRDHERETIISRNTECTEGNRILADGGAYLPLDTGSLYTGGIGAASSSAQPVLAHSHANGILCDTDAVSINADGPRSFGTWSQPVHTRPRSPTASGFAGDTGQQHGAASVAVNTAHIPAPRAALPAAESYSTSIISAPANAVGAERLSDHVRHRDHFGRPSRSNLISGLMFSLAAFATLVVLSFAKTSPATLSLVLLLLVSPVSDSSGPDVQGASRSCSKKRNGTGFRHTTSHWNVLRSFPAFRSASQLLSWTQGASSPVFTQQSLHRNCRQRPAEREAVDLVA